MNTFELRTLSPYELVQQITKQYGVKVVDVLPIDPAQAALPMYVIANQMEEGIIYVNNHIITQNYILNNIDTVNSLLLHELGHILDYRESSLKFYLRAVISSFKTRRVVKKAQDTGEYTEELLKDYYNIPTEAVANKYFDLSYTDFTMEVK